MLLYQCASVIKEIGDAHVTACRVRPKSIGGERAAYNEALM